MAKTRSQATAGKSRPVRKTTKGKASIKKCTTKAKVESKANAKPMVKKALAERDLLDRALDLTNRLLPFAQQAQCIGGPAVNFFGHWNMHPSLLQFVKDKWYACLANKHDKKKLWIYQSSEALDKVTYKDLIAEIGSDDVPIIVIALSELPPTKFVATNSLQLQKQEFFSFAEKNLRWEEVIGMPRVRILQADPLTMFNQKMDYDYTLLPIIKPSDFYGKYTERVLGTVEVEVNGVVIDASSKGDVDAAIQDEGEDAQEEGRDPRITKSDRDDIISKLSKKKREKEKLNLDRLESQTFHYHGTIESHAESDGIPKSVVAAKLEAAEIYKIYLSNLPVPRTWAHFGTTGFRKSTMVNRFTGNAAGYYPN